MSSKVLIPNTLAYSQIHIGSEYSFYKILTNDDILKFAQLTGDFNPLHITPQHRNSIFPSNIVHGMLAASLFSTLVGMYCPSRNSLYLSQEIAFIKPIYPNQKVQVRGTVTSKIDAIKVISLKTEILVDGKIVIRGKAKVKVIE